MNPYFKHFKIFSHVCALWKRTKHPQTKDLDFERLKLIVLNLKSHVFYFFKALEDALKKKNTERVQYAISYCERRDYDNVMKPLLRRVSNPM